MIEALQRSSDLGQSGGPKGSRFICRKASVRYSAHDRHSPGFAPPTPTATALPPTPEVVPTALLLVVPTADVVPTAVVVPLTVLPVPPAPPVPFAPPTSTTT